MFELTRVRICTEQTGVWVPSIVPIQLWETAVSAAWLLLVCVNRWATIHSPDTIQSACSQERTNMQQTHTKTSTSSHTLPRCLLSQTHTHGVEILTFLGCFPSQATSHKTVLTTIFRVMLELWEMFQLFLSSPVVIWARIAVDNKTWNNYHCIMKVTKFDYWTHFYPLKLWIFGEKIDWVQASMLLPCFWHNIKEIPWFLGHGNKPWSVEGFSSILHKKDIGNLRYSFCALHHGIRTYPRLPRYISKCHRITMW